MKAGRAWPLMVAVLLVYGCSPAARTNIARVAQGAAQGAASAEVPATSAVKPMIFGGDDHKTYLGCLNCSEYTLDSVFNTYGEHGSPYRSVSDRRVQDVALTKPPHDLERCPKIRNSRFAIDQEKFNRSRREWETLQQREAATVGWDPCERERSSLKKRLGALEQVIEFFGPSGAITQEAGRRVERFRRNLDQHLSVFGYACNLRLEPFEVCISLPRTGCPLSLRQLSESKRFQFGVAFQIALAAITGIRFIVIDRADMLDKARRKLLTGLLLSSGVEQAIVLATAEESVPSQLPEEVKFLNLSEQIRT